MIKHDKPLPHALMLLLAIILTALTSAGCSRAASEQEGTPGEGPPTQVQITFTADSTALRPGECATLSWQVQGGFGVELNGEVVERSGERQVCPETTTTYWIGVDSGERIEREEITISVGAGTPAAPEATRATPPASGQVTVHRDLEYAAYTYGGGEHKLRLDLYLPEQSASAPSPTLIFIHGGGWWEGTKDICPGTTFAQNGYAVACVDYRLGNPDGCPQEFTFPAQIHDVKAAVRWLRANAGQYSLDANRFGALGDSSGGHLAALLGVSHGVTTLAGDQNPGYSDAVQAVGDWFGPVDVTRGPVVFEDNPCTTDFAYLNDTYGGEATPYFYWTLAWGIFLGGGLGDSPVLARAAQASPLTYIDAGDPPFLVIHGEGDGMVPISQSESLVSALKEAGVAVNFLRPPGAGHGYAGPAEEVMPSFLDPTLQFFGTYLVGE